MVQIIDNLASLSIIGGARQSRSIRITEDNNDITYYDLLQGRDGLPGRDGKRERKESLDHVDLLVVDCCTHDVLILLELNFSMLVEQVEVTIIRREVELITYVCPKILNMTVAFLISLEIKVMPVCMEQSIKVPIKEVTTIMFLVLSAMLLLERWW